MVNGSELMVKVSDSTLNAQHLTLNVQHLALNTPIVRIDPRYFRPTEVDLLLGDPTKAKTKLGWKPKYNLNRLVQEMMCSDIQLFKKDLDLQKAGHIVYQQDE